MHRSGTSLLSKILINQGVFMGSKLDSNSESIFFQRINKWILSCIGSSWDNPRTLKDLENEDIDVITNRLNKALNSRFSKSLFLGKRDLLYNKSLNKMNVTWFWMTKNIMVLASPQGLSTAPPTCRPASRAPRVRGLRPPR